MAGILGSTVSTWGASGNSIQFDFSSDAQIEAPAAAATAIVSQIDPPSG
jgi:hypothetical protein